MAKSKSKSKKGGNNSSSAKNIKALIAQNKMIENQNAEATREAEERKLAREAEKEAKAKQRAEAEVIEKENLATATADEIIVDETVADNENEISKKSDDNKNDKNKRDTKKDKKDKKSKKTRESLGKKVKDTASELKKVTWPGFPDVVKKTGIVFAVVIFFGAILLAFDFLMSLLYKLFIS